MPSWRSTKAIGDGEGGREKRHADEVVVSIGRLNAISLDFGAPDLFTQVRALL